ncbi:MAG TPA: glycosyltransferase family 4 protein [Thermoanaerobaculia bacterium]|nr:glycosyltransferase family 4 protein [Thermoanaerobaculia bacterium]
MALRVAHVSTVDLSLHHLLLDQLLSLAAEGYEVIGVSAPGPHVAALEKAGIRHRAVAMTRRVTPLRDLAALLALFRLFRRERITLVHAHTPKAAFLGQIAARLAGVPVVVDTLHGIPVTDHAPPWARTLVFAALRLGALCSHRILVQGREDFEAILAAGVAPPEKVRLLGNGIDLSSFQPERYDAEARRAKREELRIPAGVPVVTFIGRLTVSKGFDQFLGAARLVSDAGFEAVWLVVGEPDLATHDPLGAPLAEKLGIAERCRFLGWREREEIPALLAVSDLLVLPSAREGFPRAVMEASAMGVPVVASDVRGCREAVVAGETGLLVPFGDVPALGAAIAGLLADPARRRALGEGGRRLAVAEMDQQRVFTRVKAAYRELLAEAGLSAPGPGPA